MVAASVITVMDNGLEATAITEFAGQFWSGRALGVQNTTQRLMTLAGPPMFGAIIGTFGYPVAFALCGLFPLAAVPVGARPPRRAPGFEDSGEQQPLAESCLKLFVPTTNQATHPARICGSARPADVRLLNHWGEHVVTQ